MRARRPTLLAAAALAFLALNQPLRATPPSAATGYLQTNLTSDIAGAAHTDANLVNPWGMASSATSPIWVADNGSGLSTLYNGSGTPQALVVSMPAASPPTGVVFNPTTDFSTTTADTFLFSTEDGRILGWRGALGTSTEVLADQSGANAVYKGLALGNNGTANFLYATNFHAGTVDVFDHNLTLTTLTGTFTDPSLPSGFAPFGIQNLGGSLYITFAVQDVAKQDDVPGAGHGIVDEFSTNGLFVRRVVTTGALDSPWGLAVAPASFGDLAGALLVGNFGDGKINAYSQTTGTFLSTLNNPAGNPIIIQGLWGLLFGNGGNGGATNELFFTAGIPGSGAVEDHGLFGKLAAAPPSVITVPTLQTPVAVLLGLLLAGLGVARLGRRRATTAR